MPAIVEDQVFPTLQDFKNALREWAIERNFTPHILDSDSHRVRAGCRSSPDCPFRIRANYNEKRGNAKVTTCDDVHNCVSTADFAAHQNIKRAETGRLKFLVEAVPKLLAVGVTTTTGQIIEAVERRYGQKIPVRQAQKVKRALAGRIHGPCRYCRRDGHSRRNCPVRKRNEANGVMDRPDELAPELFDFGQDGMVSDSAGDYGTQSERRCTTCFQPGHTRNNCPSHTTVVGSTTGPQLNHSTTANSQPRQTHGQSSTPARLEPFLDPNLGQPGSTLLHTTHTHSSQQQPTSSSGPGTNILASSSNQSLRVPQTPADARMEAAKLMSQAARLMNEAAKMNAEAARITAAMANT